MNKPTRILPDETAEAAAFTQKLDQVLDPYLFDYLMKRHPDGVRVHDIADRLQLLLSEADQLVRLAEVAGKLKIRRQHSFGQDGEIRFVWPAGWMPPLSSIEKLLFRQAQRDLSAGPEAIWIVGAANELGVSTRAVRTALDFLVFADLLKREGKLYALTELGQTEGEAA